MSEEGYRDILVEKEIHKIILLGIVYGNYCKIAAAAEKELLVLNLSISGNVKAQLIRGTALQKGDEQTV